MKLYLHLLEFKLLDIHNNPLCNLKDNNPVFVLCDPEPPVIQGNRKVEKTSQKSNQ